MLEVFVILGGVAIILLVAGLIVDSKDVGRRGLSLGRGDGLGRAGWEKTRSPRKVGDQGGYLFISQPWS